MDMLGFALQIIKTECLAPDSCFSCPLYSTYGEQCILKCEQPNYWNLKGDHVAKDKPFIESED